MVLSYLRAYLLANRCHLIAFALVHVISVDSMEVSIMDVVHMISMLDGSTSAVFAVLMVMVVVYSASVADRVLALRACLWHK